MSSSYKTSLINETKLDIEEILSRGQEEYRQFVNPLIAQRADLAREPVGVVRAASGALVDREGQVYEDFHGTQAFGHRPPAIARAIEEFLKSDAPSWYPSRVNPFSGRLARRLCERSGYSYTYFSCTGADAVEAGIKLARAATRKPGLLCLEGGYHGCTMGAVSLMQAGPFKEAFAPHLPGVRTLPWGDIPALKAELETGDVGGVIVEPVQGEGGVRALPEDYIQALCDLTKKHDALLITDEVQTALGRSGVFFAGGAWPRRPDAVLMGKALGGGLMPISAMLSTREMFDRAYGSQFEAAESHNSTFSYNAVSAVASLATLDLLSDELIEHIRVNGEGFRAKLHGALQDLPLFSEVRGRGYMIGIELKTSDHPWISFESFGYPELAGRSTIGPLLCRRLYRRGFICYPCGHVWNIVRLQPRFDIENEKLDEFVQACQEEVAALCEIM